MSAYTMHTSEELWGADARVFNPDRWLQPETKHLEQYLCTFSKGTRMCIGPKFVLCSIFRIILLTFIVSLMLKLRLLWRTCSETSISAPLPPQTFVRLRGGIRSLWNTRSLVCLYSSLVSRRSKNGIEIQRYSFSHSYLSISRGAMGAKSHIE